MFENIDDYVQNRYLPLENDFLNATKKTLSDNSDTIKEFLLTQLQHEIAVANEIQSVEKIPCAYISISFLSTSIIGDKPNFQVDFYDECWTYGVNLARGRLDADFLFAHWNTFKAAALDEKFYAPSKIFQLEIKNLFWKTLDKLIRLSANFAMNFIDDIKTSDDFTALIKADSFFITCGIYLEWQKKICAILPELDISNPLPNDDFTFRTFLNKSYQQKIFSNLNLSNCLFQHCKFHNCNFENLNFSNATFRNCDFFDSNFIALKLQGTNFYQCQFHNCNFKNSCATPKKNDVLNFFEPLKFDHCQISNSITSNCDFILPELDYITPK